jgi:transcriptional regulator with XRE-family HTH domain
MNTTLELTSLKSRLRYALERAGLTQRDLAKKCQVTEQAVSKWLQSRVPYEQQEKVAKLLGVSVGWLTHGETPAGDRATLQEIPILTWESITGQRREIGRTWSVGVSDKAFGLIVHGDSMIGPSVPSYPEGAVIVVDPECVPANGSRVIAQLPGDGVAFRSYVVDAGRVYLRPVNPAYPTLDGAGAKLIGTVVQTIVTEPKS